MRSLRARSARARSARAGVIGLSLLTLVAACGGSGKDSSSSGGGSSFTPVAIDGLPTIASDSALASSLPKEVRDKGSIDVATNAPFPPYEMFASDSDQTIVGLEADLGHAVGNVLGVKFNFVQQPFDGLIPSVQAGKFDVIMSTLFDTAAREQVVDLVNYSASGSGILVPTGNPQGIKTSADLCGRRVAVQTGSAQVDLVNGFNDACAGNKIAVTTLPGYSDELLSLSTGQVDAVVGDVPAIAYSLAEKANAGKFQLVTDPAQPNGYASAPVGIAIAKGADLTDPIQKALQKLMDDGTYTKLLQKWNVPEIAIDKVTVNAASGNGK